VPLGVLGAAIGLAALPAGASERIQAQAVPVKYNLTVRPGEGAARDVLISNQGDGPVVLQVHSSDWSLSDRGDLSLVPAGTTPNTLAAQVHFEPAEFSLQPGESKPIHLTAVMPRDGPATRWGVLLSLVRPAVTSSPGLRPRAIAELGTTLYVSRIPEGQQRSELTGLEVGRAGGDSLSVSVTVKNAGERHFYAGGEVAVTDSAGTGVKSGSLPTAVVLPGRVRVFTWTCPAGLSPGRYTVTATLDTGEPQLLVGETRVQWPVESQRSPLAHSSR